MDNPPAPDLIDRFRADLEAVWPESGRLGVAVSGGPDSLALLLLAHAALPGRVEAATVDHGLRPGSAAEADAVAAICAQAGVPHATLPVSVEPGNVQSRARAARYTALGAWAEERGLGALATAHHADDQAETLLMRLNRGSGLTGLAGVRTRTAIAGTTVIRPLLGWRRHELAAVVHAAGITPALDPANHDPRFDRARLRAGLAGADWLHPAGIAASAAHLAEAEDVLAALTDAAWAAGVTLTSGSARYRPAPDTPPLVRARVAARIVAALGAVEARFSDVRRLVDRLAAGQPASLGGLIATSEAGDWQFRPEPPRRAPS